MRGVAALHERVSLAGVRCLIQQSLAWSCELVSQKLHRRRSGASSTPLL
jgi:hypothetical protein